MYNFGPVMNVFMAFSIQDTMMMGADYYQTDSEVKSLLAEGKVPVGVGENTKIRFHDVFYRIPLHFYGIPSYLYYVGISSVNDGSSTFINIPLFISNFC